MFCFGIYVGGVVGVLDLISGTDGTGNKEIL